jgi:hypothetical protein
VFPDLDLGHQLVVARATVRRQARGGGAITAEFRDRFDLFASGAVFHSIRHCGVAAIFTNRLPLRRLPFSIGSSVPQAKALFAVQGQAIGRQLPAPEL